MLIFVEIKTEVVNNETRNPKGAGAPVKPANKRRTQFSLGCRKLHKKKLTKIFYDARKKLESEDDGC